MQGSPRRSARQRLRERRAWHRRVRRWLENRLPVSDAITLGQRNIYILPTRSGWAFALLLLVLLLGSINYQLNLGYALTFLLVGAAAVSIVLTHTNLNGLTLHLRPVASVHAGERATMEVVLTNPGGPRHAIAVGYYHLSRVGASETWLDVPRQAQATAKLTMVPPGRGLHAMPTLLVQTRFPLGMMRAWAVWRPAATVLAWPRLEHPAPPLPPTRAAEDRETTRSAMRRGAGEFDGVRGWRRGDPMRQIVWKKVARTGELVSRELASPADERLWLDWVAARVAGDDDEARLSRLATWVVQADRQGALVGLEIPGVAIEPGSGDAHRIALLEALARWP